MKKEFSLQKNIVLKNVPKIILCPHPCYSFPMQISKKDRSKIIFNELCRIIVKYLFVERKDKIILV